MSKPCSFCNATGHTAFTCRKKPNKPLRAARTPMRLESVKAKTKRRITYKKWLEVNPPDTDGYWTCYLQISTLCLGRVNQSTLTLEHVQPKVKAPELKYDITNIRASCSFCNKLKGSRTLSQLVKIWPHLVKYLAYNR